jgi:hypothetical protein
MSFLTPLFLLGMAAVAAPVLVHLVRRTRARRVEFPALHFVRQVPQRTIRRRTLRNLLLLAMRALAVLLIAFAFARPFLSGADSAAADEQARETVLLLDASLSMRRAGLFDEAKRRAAALLDEAQADERVALVSFGEGYDVASELTADRAQTRAALAGLAAGYEATDYEQALRGAEALFGATATGGPKRVILISDFQATGWDAARATFRLRSDVRLAAVDVGREPEANVGVVNVEARGAVYGQKYTDKLAVHVSNFSDEARASLAVDFLINDQTVEKREVSLAPRERKVVEFTGFNLAEGPNRCAVRLRADDFPEDNDFFFTLRREPRATALIIDGGGRGRGESFYLQSALATGEDMPFTFDVAGEAGADPADVQNHSLVILNDAAASPGALSESLSRFVESGGRLVIAAGPRTRAESFNRAFERVAPATLGEAVLLQRGESVRVTDVKASHPVFEVFRGGQGLSSARVFGYHTAEPRAGASVLARFDDGSPALVESGAGASGRVLLFTSTLGMSWGDLPLAPVYLPLVQQMVRYLGERETPAWHRLGETFTVARETEGRPPAIDTPAGARLREQRLTPEGDALLTGREPGFYRLRYGAGPDFAAVNIDGREGDFTKLDTDAFLASATGGDASPPPVADAGDRAAREQAEARQRLWWPLLLAALLLFAAEATLARRIRLARS